MLLRIEKGSAVPISSQIAQQIAMLCASGRLKPGERMPSVRELARELAVNQNTILRVYERLVRGELLEMRQGQGTFVADQAGAAGLAVHRERLIEELRGWSRQGLALGLDEQALHALLNEALAQLQSPAAAEKEVSK